MHRFDVKVVAPVRWKGAGARDLLLLIVRPLAYRPTRHSRLLYREPAYLLSSDPTLSVAQLLQAYLWRWEMEVAFHEEKRLLGLREAQVRTEPAVQTAPAFVAAMYGYLHLAAMQAGLQIPPLARPGWQRPKPQERCTAGHLLGLLRAELWGRALGVNIRSFTTPPTADTKAPVILSPPAAAVIYAQG